MPKLNVFSKFVKICLQRNLICLRHFVYKIIFSYAKRLIFVRIVEINVESFMKKQKTAKEIRFEKEAKALQKNIAKRKKQQQELDKKKAEKEKKRGQD
jgi:hypothetical protein